MQKGQVPGRGLEPLHLAVPDPKSGVSANFTTLAYLIFKDLRIDSPKKLARVLPNVIL